MCMHVQVYKEAVTSDRCSAIHLTHVEAQPECDTFFPDITAAGGWVGGLLMMRDECCDVILLPYRNAAQAVQ